MTLLFPLYTYAHVYVHMNINKSEHMGGKKEGNTE